MEGVDLTTWPVIEFDPNDGHPRDIITAEYAKDINVGDEVMAVCLDHQRRDVNGASRRYLDWGYTQLARVTRKAPLPDDASLVLIVAEFIPE